MKRSLLAWMTFAITCACTSDRSYAPASIEVEAGNSWYETAGAPSLDHQGPYVGLSVGWDIGPRRKTHEELWDLRPDLTRGLREIAQTARGTLDIVQSQLALEQQTAIARGVVPEYGPEVPPSWEERALEIATDPKTAFGLLIFSVAYLVLGLGRKYLGLPIPIPGFKKKQD